VEEAESALLDLDWDQFLDVAHELFGECREVKSEGIVEAGEEESRQRPLTGSSRDATG